LRNALAGGLRNNKSEVTAMMDGTRRFELPYAGSITCQLVRVMRDHHDSMVGDDRGRPGWDRVLLRLASGEEVIADVWTRTGQSITEATECIALRDDGEIVYWEPAEKCDFEAARVARAAVRGRGEVANDTRVDVANDTGAVLDVANTDVAVDSKPGVTRMDRIGSAR
jgi:hypothetical protein